VYITATTVGPRPGTYSFVSGNATAATFVAATTGNDLQTTFIKLQNCNGDASVISTLNPLLYNMYRISYGWYGTSAFQFQVLIGQQYKTIHTFTFTNNTSTPSLTFPSMYLQRFAASLGTTTPLTLKTLGSYLAYAGQQRLQLKEPQYSVQGSKTLSGAEQPIVSIRHRDTVNGIPIQAEAYIGLISIANIGAKNTIVRLYRNPTQTGDATTTDFPEWKPIASPSISAYDTTSDTFVAGTTPTLILSVAPSDSKLINLIDSGLYFGRGDTFCITAENTQSTEVNVCVQIVEFIS